MGIAQSIADIIRQEAQQRGQMGVAKAGLWPAAIGQSAEGLQGALNQIAQNRTRGLTDQRLKQQLETGGFELETAKRKEEREKQKDAAEREAQARARQAATPQEKFSIMAEYASVWEPADFRKMMEDARTEAQENLKTLEGRPGTELPTEAALPATATSPVVPLEAQRRHPEITIPGVAGPSTKVTPRTEEEDIQRQLRLKTRYDTSISKLEDWRRDNPGVPIEEFYKLEARYKSKIGEKDVKAGEVVGPDNNKIAVYKRPDGSTYTVDIGAARIPTPRDMSGLTPYQRVNQEAALRKEFNSSPAVKEYDSVRQQMARVESAIEQAKTSKNFVAIDQALINGLNKMIDPNSVVREGEYARTIQNSPLFNRILGKVDQIRAGGGGFTPEERSALVSLMRDFNRDAESLYQTHASEYERLAEESGIDPKRIVVRRDVVKPKGKAATPAASVMRSKSKSGKPIVSKDGGTTWEYE